MTKLGLAVAALCMIAFAQGRSSDNSATPLEFASVIQRLEQGQRKAKPLVPYQLIRRYQLSESNSSQVSSNVVAQVDYSPPDRETYAIQERGGSRRGEQVVRRILDHESAMVAANPASRSATLLTRDNYTFIDLGESTLDGTSFYVLGLVPKRKEKELIAGRAWVDKRTFLIRRIEGEMAESPSWLLKKVHVRLDFSEVSGLWLQTALEATADVRFTGSQTLRAQTLDCRKATVVEARGSLKYARTSRPSIPAELLFPSAKYTLRNPEANRRGPATGDQGGIPPLRLRSGQALAQRTRKDGNSRLLTLRLKKRTTAAEGGGQECPPYTTVSFTRFPTLLPVASTCHPPTLGSLHPSRFRLATDD